MTRSTLIATGGACLLAGLLLGRSLAPTRVEYRERLVEVKQSVEAKQETASQAASTVKLEGAVVTHTRWLAPAAPGCPPVDKTVDRVETRHVDKAATVASSSKVEAKQTAESRIVEKAKIVTASRPTWAVGVDGGLKFWDTTAIVRGRFELRALGPLWISAWGEPQTRSAGVGVRLEF